MGITSSNLDTVFRVLSNRRRRAALAVLLCAGRRLTLHDLTKEIVLLEHDVPITNLEEGVLTSAYLSLHHAHVPMLADAGYVEFDPERGRVTPTARIERLEPYITAASQHDLTKRARTDDGIVG